MFKLIKQIYKIGFAHPQNGFDPSSTIYAGCIPKNSCTDSEQDQYVKKHLELKLGSYGESLKYYFTNYYGNKICCNSNRCTVNSTNPFYSTTPQTSTTTTTPFLENGKKLIYFFFSIFELYILQILFTKNKKRIQMFKKFPRQYLLLYRIL